MELSEKLDTVLFQSYHSHGMREAVREVRRRKIVKEASEPLTGIYWWVPVPVGKKVKWVVKAFHDDIYDDAIHPEIWPHVLDFLKTKWKLKITPELIDAYTALPRGRVSKTVTGYAHYHGGDAPGDTGLARSQFKLSLGGNNHEIEDEHEKMLSGDPEILQKALGVNLGLQGV